MSLAASPRAIAWLLAGIFVASVACVPKPPRPRVVQIDLVATEKISDTANDLTFEIHVRNPLGDAIENVVAIATPVAGSRTIALDGESRFEGPIAAGATERNKEDTVTFRVVGDELYTGADLVWQVTYTRVGPPPNQAPLASARWATTVQVGELVSLDGSYSRDPDGDPLTYQWDFLSAPPGSTAMIVPGNAENTSFYPDQPGTYWVRLVVYDATLASAPSTVPITVTAVDPDPPSPLSIYPEPDMTEVPTNARISIFFSEPIDPASVDDTSVFVLGPDGPVDPRGIRASGNAVVFEPLVPLREGATYEVTFFRTITDRQGQPLDADVVWVFSTGGAIDLAAPEVWNVWPADGATGVVPIDPDAIAVDFTEAIDPATIASRFTVARADGTAVPGRVERVGTYRARFVPELAGASFENQTWTATIDAGVLDTAGNALVEPYSWTFSTRPSHAPAWLSRPGVGSAADTEAYYAGLPLRHDCTWDWYGWECNGTGAPEPFVDFLWDLGWNPAREPRAVFYDANDLAVGRNLKCFRGRPTDGGVNPPGAPVRGWDDGSDPHPNLRDSGTEVACYATNHGPQPGTLPHPDAGNAISEAIGEIAPFSISAMFKKHDGSPLDRVLDVSEQWGGASIAVERGDVVTVGPASGSVWGGSIFHGENGPDGAGVPCTPPIIDPDLYPCPLQGAPLYGLLVETATARRDDGQVISGRHFLGTGVVEFKMLERGAVNLRINDQDPGDGSGSFSVPVHVERANGVMFFVYVPTPNGWQLAPTATFDDEGPKRVPQACMACHGGTWDPETQTVTGATFLPLDVGRLELPTQAGWNRAAQEASFHRLNQMILEAQHWRPTGAGTIAPFVQGSYGGTQVWNDAYVPPEWSGDATLYRDVARPYCLSCHQALHAGIDFDSAAEFRALGSTIRTSVCTQRSMPHAGATFEAFWQSGAVDVLRAAMFGGAACGP